MKINLALAALVLAVLPLYAFRGQVSVHAAQQPLQTEVGGHAVQYHDTFSPSGGHATDAQLGFATHWEGLVDASTPNSPITWTRAKTATVTPDISCNTGQNWCADTCTGSGGIRLWVNPNESGDCIKYTKYSSTSPATISLGGVQYPYSSSYVSNSQAFSTYGSNGSGTLTCGGTGWPYGSNQNYGNLFNASGHVCDGTTGNLQTLHIN